MSGYTFNHSMVNGFNNVSVRKEHTVVGFLIWDGNDDGRIEDLYVNPEHRRQGLATSLYYEAVTYAKANYLLKPAHSETRTALGELWAKTMPNYFETEGIIEAYTD